MKLTILLFAVLAVAQVGFGQGSGVYLTADGYKNTIPFPALGDPCTTDDGYKGKWTDHSGLTGSFILGCDAIEFEGPKPLPSTTTTVDGVLVSPKRWYCAPTYSLDGFEFVWADGIAEIHPKRCVRKEKAELGKKGDAAPSQGNVITEDKSGLWHCPNGVIIRMLGEENRMPTQADCEYFESPTSR